jgi:DNA-binding beta-propeller fold protein YncE
MVFVADDSGVISAYAEPDLAAAIGPVSSGPLNAVATIEQPPNPFTIIGTLEPSTTTLKTLLAFDVGPDGLIYALDGKPSVTVIDPATGKVVRTWGRQGTGDGEFDVRDLANGNPGAGDIDVGLDGTVYVADGANHRVQVFNPDGTFIRQMGSFGQEPGQFNTARVVAADAEGSVYVGDDPTGSLTKFGPDGAFVWRNSGGSKWTGPTAQLPDGRIASLGDSGVYTLDPATGKAIDRWGTSGNAFGEFSGCDFAVDGAGNEYINSCAPNRTQVFDPDHNLVGGVYGPNEAILYPVFGRNGEVYGLTADRFASDNIYVLKDSLLTP